MTLADNTLPNALIDADTSWDVVKWYNPLDVTDPWKTHRLDFSANDLTSIDNTIGLWVHIPDAGSLGDGFIDIEGIMPETTAIQLYIGWNLVGYSPITPALASDALPQEVDMISVYDAAEPYMIRDVTDMTTVTLECYKGVWVHVTANTIWIVDA